MSNRFNAGLTRQVQPLEASGVAIVGATIASVLIVFLARCVSFFKNSARKLVSEGARVRVARVGTTKANCSIRLNRDRLYISRVGRVGVDSQPMPFGDKRGHHVLR